MVARKKKNECIILSRSYEMQTNLSIHTFIKRPDYYPETKYKYAILFMKIW